MKNIPAYKNYSINENGEVWSHNWNRLKNQFVFRNGYKAVSLSKDGKQKNYTIHSLVLLTFLGDRPSPKYQAMHLDGDKKNNSLSNLKWGTVRENHLDKKNHGTFQEGEKHGMHKLNKEQVLLIRNSSLSQVHFAKLFSVTPQCIAYARNIGWKSLDEKPA
jgi:hypothetical protein